MNRVQHVKTKSVRSNTLFLFCIFLKLYTTREVVVLQNEEFYVCIYSHRQGDTILFHHEGGVEVGDVDAKVIDLVDMQL